MYDEILYYIHQHPVDILMLQETKWRFSSSWDTQKYFFVHSGSQEPDHKQGGLLTIVAKRLVDSGTLRHVEPIPGRLLRLQFCRRSQPCDIVNFYQHTWRASDHVRRLRHQALDQLTRTIQIIPKRSLMIIGGDFNATCAGSAPHVGPHVMARAQSWATDQEDLQALLLGLDLCALNTFQPHTHTCGVPSVPTLTSSLLGVNSRTAFHDNPTLCTIIPWVHGEVELGISWYLPKSPSVGARGQVAPSLPLRLPLIDMLSLMPSLVRPIHAFQPFVRICNLRLTLLQLTSHPCMTRFTPLRFDIFLSRLMFEVHSPGRTAPYSSMPPVCGVTCVAYADGPPARRRTRVHRPCFNVGVTVSCTSACTVGHSSRVENFASNDD